MKKPSKVLNSAYSAPFLGSLIIAGLAGIFAPRVLAFLPAILTLCFITTLLIKEKVVLWPNQKETILFSSILILGFCSAFWAPDQNFSIERCTKILAIFLPGLFLLPLARNIKWPDKKNMLYTLIGLHLFIASFLFIEKYSGHPVIEFFSDKDVYSFKLNRSFVVFALTSLPLLFFIKSEVRSAPKKFLLLMLVICSTAISLSQAESQTAQLCFIIGILFLTLYPVKIRALIPILGSVIIIVALCFPFLIKPLQSSIPEEKLMNGILKQASIIHRLEVWSYAADKAIDKPLYGNGIESLRFMKSDTWMEHQKADNALHAHNAILQIWAEFGIIGILLSCALIAYILRQIYRTESVQAQHLYITMFVSIMSCALTGYGLWQGWQVGLFFMLATLTIFIGNRLKHKA